MEIHRPRISYNCNHGGELDYDCNGLEVKQDGDCGNKLSTNRYTDNDKTENGHF